MKNQSHFVTVVIKFILIIIAIFDRSEKKKKKTLSLLKEHSQQDLVAETANHF